MVNHVICWTLKDDVSDRETILREMKESVEGLMGQIPGLLSIRVQIDGLETSNADALLLSSFTDENALSGYAVHPLHVEVADTKVRPFMKLRSCFDYEE